MTVLKQMAEGREVRTGTARKSVAYETDPLRDTELPT
ncbi:hypothetical protein ABH922_005198 [Rhodococcus sp. 27YEA15]|jgi:hypothetical protein